MPNVYKKFDPEKKPRVLTPEACKTILRCLASGNFETRALKEAKVSRETLDFWRAKVDRGDAPQWAIDFYDALECVCAKAENDAIATITGGLCPYWSQLAWWLTRRYPKRWAQKGHVEGTNAPLDVPSPRDEDGNEIDL